MGRLGDLLGGNAPASPATPVPAAAPSVPDEPVAAPAVEESPAAEVEVSDEVPAASGDSPLEAG